MISQSACWRKLVAIGIQPPKENIDVLGKNADLSMGAWIIWLHEGLFQGKAAFSSQQADFLAQAQFGLKPTLSHGKEKTFLAYRRKFPMETLRPTCPFFQLDINLLKDIRRHEEFTENPVLALVRDF